MRAQDRFFSQMLQVVLPLLVWAAHFFFCYVYSAVACQRAVLTTASLAAVIVAALLGARAARRTTKAAGKLRLFDWATLCIALLALVAIVLSSVPVLMLPC